MLVLYFLIWLFCLYWIHRIFHLIPVLKRIHFDHHIYINKNVGYNWHWSNLFLYNDTHMSTLDLWLTEVIPTIIFSYITGEWWIFYFYYLWAAFVQEMVEHNPKINLYPFLTSGRWHLLHHSYSKCNYGLFFPIFDILFGTERSLSSVKKEHLK